MKTRTYYQIRTSLTSFAPEYFETIDEARTYATKEYTNRSKKDGYDEYWRTRELTIEKVTIITEECLKTPEIDISGGNSNNEKTELKILH